MATTELLDDVHPELSAEGALATSAPSNTQRVATGFGQSFVGPLNIARGLTGIGLSIAGKFLSVVSSLVRKALKVKLASKVLSTVRSSRASHAVADDAAPSTPAKGAGLRKPLLLTLVVALVLAVGGAAFKLLRTPKSPPVAAEPPRVRPASGATGDSAPAAVEEVEEVAAIAVDEDPRKRGE